MTVEPFMVRQSVPAGSAQASCAKARTRFAQPGIHSGDTFGRLPENLTFLETRQGPFVQSIFD